MNAAGAMDTLSHFSDSPMDQDDIVYPCKGCGEILEEGKAFELAGNRWHIDCFRCNTCGTLLDSDANLLLLGDGSLICNNCTYSCNACGNKIEDLAILTGDQAFCASCFRCRNCKRKIENLRYARTSQGIFCMSCHESLMARRRKKSKAARQQPAAANGTAPVVLDKSLPALPPSAIPQGAFSPTPEVETPSEQYSETPTERSPSKLRRNGSSRDIKREHSPASLEDSRKGMLRHATGRLPTANETADTLTLPASTYQETRPSHESQRSEPSLNGSGEDGLYVPLALDPNPAPTPSPLARSRKHNENSAEQGSTRPAESKTPGRDYFNNGRLISSTSHRDALKENRQASSRDTSTEREQQHGYTKLSTSPHIAYQEKGRQPSVDLVESIRKRSHTSVPVSPVFSSDKSRSQPGQQALQSDFKLQEAPRSRMSGGSRKNSKSDTLSPSITPTLDSAERSPPSERDVASPDPLEQSWPPPSAQDALNRDGSSGISQISNSSSSHVERPRREDSLPSSSLKQALARKDVGSTGRSSPSTPAPPSGFTHERNASTSSIRANYEDTNALQPNGGRTMSKSARSHSPKSSLDVAPPARSSSRPMPQDTAVSADSFTVPRAPPLPPPPQFDPHHRVNESISTLHSDMSHSMSPVGTLPRYSVGGEFTMEEDMARILRGEEQHEDKPPSVMRKMSNAVARHGRSFSDKGSRATNMHKLRSPLNGSIDISSPTMASPGREEDVILLRNQLRRAQQRIADLETDKNQLQEMVNSSVDIKQVNVELREKRSTMAFLDTQREMVVRELEVMTEHLKRAKESNAPINMQSYKSEIIHDLATSLHKLKDNLGGQIEELTQRKNNLQNEITELIQMKDKGFQEYDSLSTKNTQLTQLNSQLVSNIQGLYQLDKDRHQQHAVSLDGGRPPANGLGIYTHHQKDRSDMSMELRDRIAQDNQFANMMQDPDGAEPTVLNAPQVVNIRKGKPNMWKKGSQAVAKNIKGIKGAFGSDKQDPYRVGHYTTEGVPYGSYTTTSEASTPVSISKNGADPARLGFLNAQKGTAVKGGTAKTMQQNNSNTNVAALDASALFGSDLTARCDFEKRVIPSIVSRCIQEVEMRGMLVEGIYRKSGGSGQVNTIKAGFEKDSEYDISDEDLDIHAVTSALKQYFRRLPTPLITFDVYDMLLEAGQIRDTEKRVAAIREAINELPRCHRDCLEFLVFHLARVMDHESNNLMTPHNLAVVFAPTIMRPVAIEREISDMLPQRTAVQALLEHNKVIFGEQD